MPTSQSANSSPRDTRDPSGSLKNFQYAGLLLRTENWELFFPNQFFSRRHDSGIRQPNLLFKKFEKIIVKALG